MAEIKNPRFSPESSSSPHPYLFQPFKCMMYRGLHFARALLHENKSESASEHAGPTTAMPLNTTNGDRDIRWIASKRWIGDRRARAACATSPRAETIDYMYEYEYCSKKAPKHFYGTTRNIIQAEDRRIWSMMMRTTTHQMMTCKHPMPAACSSSAAVKDLFFFHCCCLIIKNLGDMCDVLLQSIP